MKTSELTGAQLDWAVAKCEGIKILYQPGFITYSEIRVLSDWDDALEYSPSTDWSQAGPIIEREGLELSVHVIHNGRITSWASEKDWPSESQKSALGPTPLVAAMRCYVASKLGEEVEVPKELA